KLPYYQRYFDWSDPQFKDLWNDICRQIEMSKFENTKYFRHMGEIILYKPLLTDLNQPIDEDDEYEDKTIYYLNDGQQRLTTLIILLRSCCTFLNDSKMRDVIAKRYYDRLTLDSHI